jgi:hypothetical protein
MSFGFQAHDIPVEFISISPDLAKLATAAGGEIHLWEPGVFLHEFGVCVP